MNHLVTSVYDTDISNEYGITGDRTLMSNPIVNDVDDVDYDDDGSGISDIQCLRVRLEYYFMDPIKKWRKNRTKPWKLLIQILKLLVFTTQLVIFGSDMAKFINYKDEMQTTFKQMFLKDWDPSADAIAYPGPYVPYAVYTKKDFIHTINYAIRVYSNVSEQSLGPFGYQSNKSDTVSPITFCVTSYAKSDFDPSQFSYNYSMELSTNCTVIENVAQAGSSKWQEFDIRQHLDNDLNFPPLISARLDLPLRTLLIEEATSSNAVVVCFNLDIRVIFDNRNRDGQIVINLLSNPTRAKCDGQLVEKMSHFAARWLLNIAVVVFCVLSFCLCARSLWRSTRLLIKTEKILCIYRRHLTWSDRIEFIDPWLVLIIFNDIMIMSATSIIAFYDDRLLETDNYTICSMLIGIGNFFSWIGLLRYLSFFKQYNLLLVTLRKSFIHVTRFMFCTLIIYCGFCFCGWIVFGPYHFKFRQLSTTTECLFSLINGDDMFETFALLRSEIGLVWWFSRIYLYLFVSLFIYVVLSLFIALIMDAYEIIKQYGSEGFPKTRLQSFYVHGDITKLPLVSG